MYFTAISGSPNRYYPFIEPLLPVRRTATICSLELLLAVSVVPNLLPSVWAYSQLLSSFSSSSSFLLYII